MSEPHDPIALPTNLLYVGDYALPTRASTTLPTRKFKSNRRAARAVILDDDNRVHIIHASNHGFYKIVGGGINAGESIDAALEREILEETGYSARVLEPVGYTVQYSEEEDFYQESYVFLARLVGQGNAKLEADEAAAGFVPAVFDNALAARDAVLSSNTEGQQWDSNQCMIFRDAAILEAAAKIIALSN